jgi:hypothetical protein
MNLQQLIKGRNCCELRKFIDLLNQDGCILNYDRFGFENIRQEGSQLNWRARKIRTTIATMMAIYLISVLRINSSVADCLVNRNSP